MAKLSKAPKAERRSRGEIDRNYFFGDIFIKMGVASAVAIGVVALYSQVTLREALHRGMVDYLVVMGGFAVLGLSCYLIGWHLRKTATHWDFD